MRLIDADVRIDDLQYELKAGYMGCEKADYFEKLIQDYKDQPVIDAKPIIHGHWKDENYTCSICGGSLDRIMDADSYFAIGFKAPPFCCFCGAKMDEKCEVEKDDTERKT